MDFKELQRLERMRNNCKKCKGSGYKEVESANGDLTIEDCSCVKKIHREVALVEANIPVQYRTWNFNKDLNKDFKARNGGAITIVEKFIKELDGNIEAGRGLWFNAQPGLVKSSIICWILRRALCKGYSAYYERASHIVSLKFQAMREDYDARTLLKEILSKTHIMAIEEIDKRYQTKEEDSLANMFFYEFLADAYDANISLLISTNKTRTDFERLLPGFITDRFKALEDIPFVGRSGRRKV